MKLLNLKSRLRRKLLTLYFTNPEKKYYVNQLARLLKDSAGNVRNELMNMVKDGLFERETLGNLVFYKLHTSHPLYSELQSIIKKSIGVVGGLKEALQNITNIKVAFIFGSFAKEEESALSDIDLFIIGNPDRENLRKTISSQEKAFSREINYHLYSDQDWQKKKKNKEGFIINLMENQKIFLIGDNICL